MHGRGAHFLWLDESAARREQLLGPVMRAQRLKEPWSRLAQMLIATALVIYKVDKVSLWALVVHSFWDCSLSAENSASLVASSVGQLSFVWFLTAIVAETLALKIAPVKGAIVLVIVHWGCRPWIDTAHPLNVGQVSLISSNLVSQLLHLYGIIAYFFPHSVRFHFGLLLAPFKWDVLLVNLVLQSDDFIALVLDLLDILLFADSLL